MKIHNGFTLIELMVVVAIVAILAVVAVPNLSDMLAANRVQAEQREFAGALSTARSEAAARGKSVTLCHSNNGTGCGGSWSDGWIIFQDGESSGYLGFVDPAETVIRVGNSGSAGVSVFDASGDAVGFICFDSHGASYFGSGSVSGAQCRDMSSDSVTVQLCGEAPRHARAVLLTRTGRAALSQADPNTGIHQDASGNPLVCP